jgi:hypothetical protein
VTAPAVRAAVYLVFATRWIVQWTIWAVVALIGLLAIYIAGMWVYSEQPWYDNDVVHQLTNNPHTTPWAEDVSNLAVALFPDGMSAEAALALLRKNGFSCTKAAEPSSGEGFACHRTTHVLPCNNYYDIELLLDPRRNIVGRKAQFHQACL